MFATLCNQKAHNQVIVEGAKCRPTQSVPYNDLASTAFALVLFVGPVRRGASRKQLVIWSPAVSKFRFWQVTAALARLFFQAVCRKEGVTRFN